MNMADVKWISISTDIFNNEKMCAIESLPDGHSIELVWFKLLCLAGTCNESGFLMISRELPYTDEMIAKYFRMDIGVIKRALEVFQKMEMIELINDIYLVSNWSKYQNDSELQRIRETNKIRQQRYRDSKKALIQKNICQYCGAKATGYDHVIALSKGGSDIESNKVWCCIDCNRKKGNHSLVDFLNSNRDRIRDDIVLDNPILNKLVELEDGKYRNVTVTQQDNVTCHEFCSICNMYYLDVYKDIINYLNLKTNKTYKYKTKKYQRLIHARCEEGYGIEDFKKVIDAKTNQWLKNKEMEKYLRPDTLFAASHFDSYLNEYVEPPKSKYADAIERMNKHMEERTKEIGDVDLGDFY